MALNTTEDAAAILYDQRGQRIAVEPPVEALPTEAPQIVAEAEANAEPVPGILDAPDVVPVADPDKPIRVAGMVDNLFRKFGKSVAEAEKKVLPPLAPDPVQKLGGNLLVRGMAQDEIDRLSQLLPTYEKGINFPRIAEDMGSLNLAEYTERLKAANADLFEKARRGTLNFEALLAKADAKGADAYIVQWMQDGVKAGAKPEDLLGGVLAAVQLSKETQAQLLHAQGLTGPAREEAYRRFTQMMTVEAQVYANLSAYGSEAGRSLYVLSQSAKMGGVDMAARAEEITNLFGAKSASDFEYLGEMYMKLDAGSRVNFVKQGLGAKSMDVIAEVYINSLLSSPVTHVVNVAGNSLFMATRVAETYVAGAIGGVRSKITGNADRVYMQEWTAQLQGIVNGFWDALKVGGKTLLTEEAPDAASKIDIRNRRAIGTSGDPRVIMEEFRNGNFMAGAVNVLGSYYRMPGRFMLAEDQFFKGIGYRMHLHGEAEMRSIKAYEAAIETGKTPQEALAAANAERARIIAQPPGNVIKDATEAAKEMTFQKDLDGFLGNLGDAMAHPVAKLFVPFFRTPTNIAKAVFERSPMVLANPSFYKTVAAGGRDADIAMSKLALGSAVMGSFAYAAMGLQDDGIMITGAGPTASQARDAFTRQGLQPYSIALRQADGTWTSVSYNRFDPLSGVLAMAADFAYYAQHEQNPSVLEDLATAAQMSLMNYMMDQPMLAGIQEFAGAFTQPDPKLRVEMMNKIFGENAGSAVLSMAPGNSALGGAISRYRNPERANTMVPERGLFGEDPTQHHPLVQGFYQALQKAKSQNPFFNETLPPALNEWGERIPASNGAAWEFVSPVRIRDSKYAPVDEEIMRLGGGIARTPKKISGVDLNAVQFNRLIELTNALDASMRLPGETGYNPSLTLLPTLAELIAAPDYAKLPTKEDQKQQISNMVSSFRSMARQKLMMEDPYLKAKIDSKP